MPVHWRLRAFGSAIWDAWPAWLAIGGLALAVGFCIAGWPFHTLVSKRLLYAGMALEFGGLVLVWCDLNRTLEKFGRPSLWGQVFRWSGRLADLFKPTHPAHLSVAIKGNSHTNSTLNVGREAGKGASTDERISALEENFQAYRSSTDDKILKLRAEMDAADQRIVQLTRESQTATQNLARTVEDQAVGGTHMEFVGLIWVLAGIFLTNINEDIACWLGYS